MDKQDQEQSENDIDMKSLLFQPLSTKMRFFNRHKKEKKPREKRKHKSKPRPKNRAALVRRQKKAR
jgi:hypothetical protein